MITTVVLTTKARKDLIKVPFYIGLKLQTWIDQVTHEGLEATRKIAGYHDEPLKGEWKGFRSIRLSQSYRAFYTLKDDGMLKFVAVERINKHEY
jgi:proteic killer suppression protein